MGYNPHQRTRVHWDTVNERRPVWDIRTPVVCRYLDACYVEEFFQYGRIRLSSFAEFAQHKDEQRMDALEGVATLTGMGPAQTTFAQVRAGPNALVLCGSVLESRDLMHVFGVNSYFRITDTIAFSQTIAARLEGYAGGIEGYCHYKGTRVIRRRVPFDPKDFELNGGGLAMADMSRYIAMIAGTEVYLLKHHDYAHQCEYRFVWKVKNDNPRSLVLECPDAVQFCERGSLD